MKKESKHSEMDRDLIEEIDDEEMYELVQEARLEALQEQKNATTTKKPKWIFWLIAITFLFSTFSFVFQTFSIPAIEFVLTSAKLSVNKEIQSYKKAVVSVVTKSGTGTGFAISSDGEILTNNHVIDGYDEVTIAFPDHGIHTAKVVNTYAEIDLALLKVDGEEFPFLQIDKQALWKKDDAIYFIGNPLRFNGIVNKGIIIDSIILKDWKNEVVMIQAPVYRGNSGSPVINKNGDVIGVIFATMKHEQYGKVGLFVPVDLYKP